MTDKSSMLGDGQIAQSVISRLNTERTSLRPDIPGKIAIEINNSCNHECFFCPNPTMTRKTRVINRSLVFKIMDEAASLGIKEISFYSTGEPFLNKDLVNYIKYAKTIGFDYVFLSTNGGKVVSSKILPALEAGLDSLKFSINAGDRETYALVHGKDEFLEVIGNLKKVNEWRKLNRNIKLFVSFVETDISKASFDSLKELAGSWVDEIVRYPFVVIGTPLVERKDGVERPFINYANVDKSIDLNVWRTTLPCYQLWSYLNVTVEGYLSACCSDFNNDLIVGNINKTGLMGAWHSEEFQELRRRHIENRVGGTLCAGCIKQKAMPYKAINQHLLDE